MNEVYESSMFKAIIVKNILIIHFKNNNIIYLYKELTKEILNDFIKSESKWRFFLQKIKNAKFIKTDYKDFKEAEEKIG